MEGNPLVSVIVPVYKVEQYVKLCVDSILAQTFQDFEIILVDDASPDGSVALCQKLYGDNAKVKFVRHEKNLGLGAARNTGMKHAVGKYVYFVDSDDLILPDALEKFFNAAEKTNADVVHATGWYALYQDEPAPFRQEDLEPGSDDYTREGFLPTDLIYRLDEHWKKYNTRPMAWLCFCRRDFLESNGIEFLPIISEDEPFSFALLYCTRRYYVLPATLYVYRRRTDSITQTHDAANLAKVIQSMARGSAYIKNFLDRIPRFDGYDSWCKDMIGTFFNRFVYVHTMKYYADLSLSPEASVAVDDALEKLFGENAPFVSNFFHGYHMFLCQAELLDQHVKLLQEENRRLKGEHTADAIVDALKSADKRVLLLGTPAHGNIGDQAIVAGELRILKDYFPDRSVIEIPYDYLTGGLGFAKHVRRDDLIFMHGGGNLGNLWLHEEQLRRALIEAFPDNKIIIFPQSICFTDDADGRRELPRSQRIYNAHDDLHLMTRDEVSFEFAQKFFPRVNNYLAPDAATVLHGITDDVDTEREGVLFVLRGDREKVRDDAKIKILQDSFAEAGIPFEVVDTVINETVTADTRDEKIRAVLLKIRKSKLVVTDRFHGVVFAFVTRTPVLAFKSFDTKISSGVKWFENFPSVFYAEDTDWSAVETFVNLALDDAAVFAELNSDVKIDGEALFFDALNQILKPGDDEHTVGAQIESIENPTDIDAFGYVQAKYSAFRDTLPIYKSDGDTPKIFWWCWLQGLENAPPIAKMCLKSLRRNYSDYTINVVTLNNMANYVSFPEHIIEKFTAGKISPTHFSDLLRLELLINHGGIWLDSCVLCTGRETDYLQEPLFIFQSTWRNAMHLGSNWFIVSEKGNPILKTTRDLLYKYWQDHDALGNGGFYFVFHWMFRLAAEKYPYEWLKIPLVSNIPPHVLQIEFFKPYAPDRFEQIKRMSHFHKLSWKYNPARLTPEKTAGTNYDYLMKFLS